jgi:hypothetical protein
VERLGSVVRWRLLKGKRAVLVMTQRATGVTLAPERVERLHTSRFTLHNSISTGYRLFHFPISESSNYDIGKTLVLFMRSISPSVTLDRTPVNLLTRSFTKGNDTRPQVSHYSISLCISLLFLFSVLNSINSECSCYFSWPKHRHEIIVPSDRIFGLAF